MKMGGPKVAIKRGAYVRGSDVMGLGLEEGLLLGIKVQLLLKTNFVSRCGHQQAGGRRASRPRLLYDWDFINGMRNIYVRNIDQLVGL